VLHRPFDSLEDPHHRCSHRRYARHTASKKDIDFGVSTVATIAFVGGVVAWGSDRLVLLMPFVTLWVYGKKTTVKVTALCWVALLFSKSNSLVMPQGQDVSDLSQWVNFTAFPFNQNDYNTLGGLVIGATGAPLLVLALLASCLWIWMRTRPHGSSTPTVSPNRSAPLPKQDRPQDG